MPGFVVNDLHSQLNATRVARVLEPVGLGALVEVIRSARAAGATRWAGSNSAPIRGWWI